MRVERVHWENVMGIFSNLFGGRQRSVMAQLPQVESAVGNCVADFKDRTNLSYALIFPIMHRVAVQLYVQDFGVAGTRTHFERLVKTLTEDGTIREDQYKNFGSPEIPPEDLPRTTELSAILWNLANDLVARGCQMETVASALVNISLKAATQCGGGHYAAGLLMTSLKELRRSESTRAASAGVNVAEDFWRENTASRRQAIEQTPRVSPVEIARNAAQFTLAGMEGTYNTMRRDDFCDVVLAALRTGNLSDRDASHAVYMREWVLSGADLRTSFPEWLATGEVHDGFAVLQREWLQAARQDEAIKRMSFNEWLAATDTRRLPKSLLGGRWSQ
jgi:hypothetical protein